MLIEHPFFCRQCKDIQLLIPRTHPIVAIFLGPHVVNTLELVVLGKDPFMSWQAMSKAASTPTSLVMTSWTHWDW